mmetsp:Transcript_22171/g.53947  ORF Transcript_22171/g.53947 Transcript_22171/m.53947 type:complete len:706 (-) Transcript_22171:453-2570(-)
MPGSRIARVSALALAAALGCLCATVSAAAPSTEHSRKLLQATPTYPGGVLDLSVTALHGATTGFSVYGKDAHDRLGNTVDVGDINGDGLGDVVISAFFADGAQDNMNKAGEVYVLFGQPGGWPDAIDLATVTLDGTNGFVVHGKNVNDRLGLAVAVGDINGDGYMDLALGAHLGDGSETNVVKSSGEVWVLLGKASGWSAVIDLATVTLDGSNGFVIHGMDRWDTLGFSVLIADVNGDDTGDLILGAKGGDGATDSIANAGEVHVVFGHKNGWDPTVHLEDFVFTGKNGFSVYGRDLQDRAGFSVGLGDLNGDNKADLVLGALRADGADNTSPDAGEVYILFGSGHWPAVINLQTYVLDGYNGLVIYGKDPFDRMGRSVATGDINGDGNTDLLLSSHRGDGEGNDENFQGEAYVLFGRAGWPPVIDLKTKVFSGNDGFTIYGRDGGDRTGFAVSIGDINGDGFGEIVIGSKGGDGSSDNGQGGGNSATGGSHNNIAYGEVDVIYGHAHHEGWAASYDLGENNLDGNSGFVVFGKDAGDRLGRSTAVGDLNGDGIDDLILGAFKGDGAIVNNSMSNAGEAHIIYGVPKAPVCPAGQYDYYHLSSSPTVNCVSCQSDFYCTGSGSQTKCPPHGTSPAGSSSESDCVCRAGYVKSGSACVKCGGCRSDQKVVSWCTATQPTVCSSCDSWIEHLDMSTVNFGIVRSCGV